MPRSAVVSVGILWGRPGTRTCGISVGHAGGLRRLTQPAVQGLRAPACVRGQPGSAGLRTRLILGLLTWAVCWPGACWAVADAGASRAAGMLAPEKGAGAGRVNVPGDLGECPGRGRARC